MNGINLKCNTIDCVQNVSIYIISFLTEKQSQEFITISEGSVITKGLTITNPGIFPCQSYLFHRE